MPKVTTSNGLYTAEERQKILDEVGPLITRATAAKLIGSSERTIGRQIDAGLLKLYKIGRARSLRVKTADVLDLVEWVA